MLNLTNFSTKLCSDLTQVINNRSLFKYDNKIYVVGYPNYKIMVVDTEHDDKISEFKFGNIHGVVTITDNGILHVISKCGSPLVERYNLVTEKQMENVYPTNDSFFDSAYDPSITVNNNMYKIIENNIAILSLDTYDVKYVRSSSNKFHSMGSIAYCYDNDNLIYITAIDHASGGMTLFSFDVNTENLKELSTNENMNTSKYTGFSTTIYDDGKIYFFEDTLEDKVIYYDTNVDEWISVDENKKIFVSSNVVKNKDSIYGTGYLLGEPMLVKF